MPNNDIYNMRVGTSKYTRLLKRQRSQGSASFFKVFPPFIFEFKRA